MGSYHRCSTCGEFGWETHRCKPIWECRLASDDYPNAEWGEVRGRDAEEAAEKYAELYDCEGGEYSILTGYSRGRDCIVYVREPMEHDFVGPRNIESYSITAEAIPTYTATKIEVRGM